MSFEPCTSRDPSFEHLLNLEGNNGAHHLQRPPDHTPKHVREPQAPFPGVSRQLGKLGERVLVKYEGKLGWGGKGWGGRVHGSGGEGDGG
jgi:hypothetical protein